MSQNVRTYIQGYEVDLPQIEKELVKFWKNTADDEQGAVIRATTLNLIFITTNKQDYEEASRLVAYVTEHHPARMILSHVDMESDESKITSHVSAYCQPPKQGGKQICCEQISLSTGKNGISHIPGALLPLLLPDLPVFMCCPPSSFVDMPPFEKMLRLVDRVILDTPLIYAKLDDLLATANQIHIMDEATLLSDLVWGRMTVWREAIAQLFDSQEDRTNLDNLQKIEISYSGNGFSFPAFLLAFWLATRLGWELYSFDDLKKSVVFVDKNQKQIFVDFNGKESDRKAGRLLCIKLESTNGTIYNCKFINDQLKTKIKRDRPVQENSFDYIKEDRAKLVCDELDFLHEDKVYLDAVWSISKIKSQENEDEY